MGEAEDLQDFAERTPTSAYVAVVLSASGFILHTIFAGALALFVVWPVIVLSALAALDGIVRRNGYHKGLSWFALMVTLAPFIAGSVVRAVEAPLGGALTMIVLVAAGVANGAASWLWLRTFPVLLRVSTAAVSFAAVPLVVAVSGVIVASQRDDAAFRWFSLAVLLAHISILLASRRAWMTARDQVSETNVRISSAAQLVIAAISSALALSASPATIFESEHLSPWSDWMVRDPRMGFIFGALLAGQSCIWLAHASVVSR